MWICDEIHRYKDDNITQHTKMNMISVTHKVAVTFTRVLMTVGMTAIVFGIFSMRAPSICNESVIADVMVQNVDYSFTENVSAEFCTAPIDDASTYYTEKRDVIIHWYSPLDHACQETRGVLLSRTHSSLSDDDEMRIRTKETEFSLYIDDGTGNGMELRNTYSFASSSEPDGSVTPFGSNAIQDRFFVKACYASETPHELRLDAWSNRMLMSTSFASMVTAAGVSSWGLGMILAVITIVYRRICKYRAQRLFNSFSDSKRHRSVKFTNDDGKDEDVEHYMEGPITRNRARRIKNSMTRDTEHQMIS